MSLSTSEKKKILEEHSLHEHDTGSVEAQVAILTFDIKKLTEHFKVHTKDLHSRRGLIRKVNLRRSLLKYLKRKSMERYRTLIEKLKIRG